ncbi:asparagine synthase (glutamine-hydrolyzing) [Solibacillus daqui]|uniref:asparagine synthase (glutamine-hydrolyzing) n=1 Tax=Solibacillus daqui TaxID=2912187 RepID=UPI002366E29A|nr:asparagine synthase (glutamine-hydrolyzing) [Solibacillus daqui]
MCGITGIVDFSQDLSKQRALITNMTETIAHRGPDSDGHFLSRHALLGHKRLAIIDLVTGAQPMTKGAYTIVYNGEVYNANELRAQLQQLGYHFSSTSDTEVILVSYIQWKEHCVDYLNGIFAFAIWDEEKDQLFLCRDRLGVKPLFYVELSTGLLFASEIKALLVHPSVKAEVDSDGLAALFSLGPSRIQGHAIFKGIKELKPGYILCMNREKMVSWRYWDIESKEHMDNEQQTIEQVRQLVTDAVCRQLVSDVPICTMLSGGLDSSILTAIAAKQLAFHDKTLATYSVAYEDNNKHFQTNAFQTTQDEYWIEIMQKRYGTKHMQIELQQRQLVDALTDAMRLKDMPSMADVDSSLYLFSKEIKKNHVVALSGECADEVFGGYPWFYSQQQASFPWLRATSEREGLLKKNWQKQLRLADYLQNTYEEAVAQMPSFVGDEEQRKRQQLFYLNNQFFMQTLLERNDRMSMGAGVEVRVPFADHTIIEYVWNIPWEMKNSGAMEKGILRQAFREVLPLEVVERKKNPYPKTYHPLYTKLVSQRLTENLQQKDSVLHELFERDQLEQLIASGGKSFQVPWFGQLMAGPQLLAYLNQVHEWVEHYRINIIST